MCFCTFRRVTQEERLFAGKELEFNNPVYYCGCNTVVDEIECSVTQDHADCIDQVHTNSVPCRS